MIKIGLRLGLSVALFLSLCARAGERPELKPFPAAQPSMERFVIALAHKERGEEDAFKVEIIVGKNMGTDGINRVLLANTIEPRVLAGWGYTYYEVTGSSAVIGTRMAVPENSPGVEQFVTAPSLLIAYNSHLPIVVYTPAGYTVKYRIWSAAQTLMSAEKQ